MNLIAKHSCLDFSVHYNEINVFMKKNKFIQYNKFEIETILNKLDIAFLLSSLEQERIDEMIENINSKIVV